MLPETKPFAIAMLVAGALFLHGHRLLGQQPFYTDDANVTEKGTRHLECSNEYDWLSLDLLPDRRQNTLVCKVAFGLPGNIEVGADAPLITIGRASGGTPRTSFGIGDTDFAAIKWNLRKPHADSHAFSLAAGFNIEFPTGRAK